MPKYVAINIGASQIQYLLADIGRKKIQVLDYGTLDLSSSSDEQPTSSEEESSTDQGLNAEEKNKTDDPKSALGEQLARKLTEVGGAGARAIIAIGRADVDIRRFTLPPASDSELAELVAIQVQSDMGGSGDQGVVDFVLQPATSNGERPVEAVVATEKTLESYQAFSRKAGIKLQRLVLRPYALASLLDYFPDRDLSDDQKSTIALLVDQIATEADLLAIDRDQVVFWRTVQLDGEPNDLAAIEGLVSEIARTLAISPTHLPTGRAIERIQLLGCEQKHARLFAKLAEQTDLRVEILDPALIPEVQGLPDTRALSADSGSEQPDMEAGDLNAWVAPLIAMLLAEANAAAPAIDLLNPRKPLPPRNNKRVAMLAALAGLILFTLAGTWLQEMHAQWDQSNEALMSKLKELNTQGKKLGPQVALVRSIATWDSAGIIWLDELRDLSQKFPSAEEVTVRGMTISSLRGGSAMIRVTCQVRDPAVIVKMDHDLRDQYRNATSTNFREQGTSGEHPWRFETVITTRRRSSNDYREMLTPRPPPPSEQPTTLEPTALDSGKSEEGVLSSGSPDTAQGSVAVKGISP